MNVAPQSDETGARPFAPPEAYGDPFADMEPVGRIVPPEADDDPPESERLFRPASRWAGQPIPPRLWHVPDLIPAAQVSLFGGPPGAGKSLLAMQLAASTALGRPWLGREIGRTGPAVFLSAEDDEGELHRRMADISTGEGFRLNDLDQLHIRSLAGADAILAAPINGKGKALRATRLYHRIEAEMQDHRPRLLILDTLADLHAGDENDRANARQFIGLLRGLALRHDCTVVVLAHPSLTGINTGSGMSGSTAWEGSVRSRLYLERVTANSTEPDPNARRLTLMKSNYSALGQEINLRWDRGRFVVLDALSGLDRMAAGAKAERVFLALLRTCAEQGRKVNHAGGTTYAPKVFAANPQAEGVAQAGFKRAMETLLADGRIRIETEGPPSRRVSYLVEGGAT